MGILVSSTNKTDNHDNNWNIVENDTKNKFKNMIQTSKFKFSFRGLWHNYKLINLCLKFDDILPIVNQREM